MQENATATIMYALESAPPTTDATNTEPLEGATPPAEWILLAILFALLLIHSLGGNLFILATVWLQRAIYNPHRACIVAMAIADLVLALSYLAPMFIYVISGVALYLSVVGCQLLRFLRMSAFLAGVHFLLILVLERYSFFMRPLKYQRLWTNSTILCMALAVWVTAAGVSTWGFFREYEFNELTMMCGPVTKAKLGLVIFVLYGLPKLCADVVVVYQIARFRRMTIHSITAIAPDVALSRSVRSALRLILMTSGLFWMTYLPLGLSKLAAVEADVDLLELDADTYPVIARVFRYLNIVYLGIPPALNPVIYLLVDKELRAGCIR